MILASFIPIAIAHFTLVNWPTTNLLYMFTILTRYNFSAIAKYILGITIADTIYVIISVYGINELGKLSPLVQLMLQLVGITIIFIFGVRVILQARRFSKLTEEERKVQMKHEHFTLQGMTLTLINPKVMMMYPILLYPLIKAGMNEADKIFVSSWFIISTPIYVFITMYIVYKFAKVDKVHSFLVKMQKFLGIALILIALNMGVWVSVKYVLGLKDLVHYIYNT